MKKKKTKPIVKGWIPLSDKNWVNWSLWNNSVTFKRRRKENGKWNTTETFHFTPKILKEISWRIPTWLNLIESQRKKNLIVLSD